MWLTVGVFFFVGCWVFGQQLALRIVTELPVQNALIGREVSVSSHLHNGQEVSLSVEKLLTRGKLLFNANWTEQEGGRRPVSKGTGRPLADPSQPLTGDRACNRISGR